MGDHYFPGGAIQAVLSIQHHTLLSFHFSSSLHGFPMNLVNSGSNFVLFVIDKSKVYNVRGSVREFTPGNTTYTTPGTHVAVYNRVFLHNIPHINVTVYTQVSPLSPTSQQESSAQCKPGSLHRVSPTSEHPWYSQR